jgi:hypothetical protein
VCHSGKEVIQAENRENSHLREKLLLLRHEKFAGLENWIMQFFPEAGRELKGV